MCGWYYVHRTPAAVYQYERPQCDMRYGTEWKDDHGRSWANPSEKAKPKLKRLVDTFDSTEIELVFAGFDLESNGKVPRRVCEAADRWLRKAAKEEPRCEKALSFPSDVERSRARKL